MKCINVHTGKPNKDMSDKQWQKYFNSMRLFVQPSVYKRMNIRSPHIYINNYACDNQFEYQGETQWIYYKKFINDILSTIRRGEKDYCYYIYQIADLLKYEHDNLRSRWRTEEECFEVWLEK